MVSPTGMPPISTTRAARRGQQQVFGRVTGERQFGKDNGVRLELVARLLGRGDHALGIAGDIAHQQSELGDNQAPAACHYFNTARMRAPISVGEGTVCTPAAARAWNFSSAVPLPPEITAPAWPMRRPGGAGTPAMDATTGFRGSRA